MQTGLTANDVRPVRTLNVSSEFFNVLGVAPFAGRLIGPEDAAAACTSSNAAVSYSWWQSQMGGRPISFAESVILDGTQYHIVGVTPPRFFGLAVGEGFDFVTPLRTPPNVGPRHPRLRRGLARSRSRARQLPARLPRCARRAR